MDLDGEDEYQDGATIGAQLSPGDESTGNQFAPPLRVVLVMTPGEAGVDERRGWK